MPLEKPRWIHFTGIGDPDVGYISVAQSFSHVPFEIKRVYWVYDTPVDVERGNHAHKSCLQVLIALIGKIEVELENELGETFTFILDTPDSGVFVPTYHWRKIHFSEGAVLLSIASESYLEEDYIREYAEFKKT